MTTFRRVFTFAILLWIGSAIADGDHHPANNIDQEKLGKVHFPVSCTPTAQNQFDKALAMLHSFWYDEAEKAFQRVISIDPNCTMGYWGIAMSLYQQLWATTPTTEEVQRARNALAQAQSLPIKTDREKAYLDAIATIYPAKDDDRDYSTRKLAYEQAMKRITEQFPDDNEATLFYALALISNVSPDDKTFVRQKQALQLLQRVLKDEPQHPGVAHYIIHSSDYPELAEFGLDAARAYMDIAPTVPHALHMSSHIFVRLGLWSDVVQSNLAAHQASQEHTSGNYGDDIHAKDFLLYAYLQLGETEKARAIMQEILATDQAHPHNTTIAYAFAAIPARFVAERGDWHAATKLSVHPTDFPWQQFGWCEALTHFTKGMGAARIGNIIEAEKSLKRLETLRDHDHAAHQDYTAGQIEIQRLAVAAWIAAAKNRSEEALQLMRASADLEDSTEKDNVTPGSIIPARELLGELLLTMNQPEAALKELETSLQRTPNRRNGISLAAQAARKAGDLSKADQYEQQFQAL